MPNNDIFDWYIPFLYPCEYKSLCGGRSSGKSHHTARNAIFRMAQLLSNPKDRGTSRPYYPPGPVRIMSGRQFNVTLPRSVKTLMETLIRQLWLHAHFQITRNDIKHPASGSECFFEGIERNVQNVLSYEGIDIWWFEQAEFLTDEQMRVILPTARHYKTCPVTGRRYVNEKWLVWNQKNRTDWAFKRFYTDRRATDLHVHVNYDSNPHLPENILELAEYDRDHYPEMYNHTWLGMPDDSDAMAQILPYKMVQACRDAWDMRPDLSGVMRTDAGFDLGLGGPDFCCLVVRTGPVVHDIRLWKGEPNMNIAAANANRSFEEVCVKHDVEPTRIFYDAANAAKGGFDSVPALCSSEGIHFNGAVSGKEAIWERDINNGDVFHKRNIQMAMGIRLRAERTARLLEGEKIDPRSCLFINPDIEGIDRAIGLLTQPIRRQNPSGRWEIDKRGGDENAKSPDEFDALCLAFAHDSKYGIRARDASTKTV